MAVEGDDARLIVLLVVVLVEMVDFGLWVVVLVVETGGFRPMGGAGGGFVPNYQVPPSLSLPPQNISGRKRGFHGSSPDRFDGSGGHSGFAFAKLFVGSVPRTATEMDIRPLFEEHGNVIEVALIKDKRTGQQQGM
ncbi:hypothetical protein OIU77_013947 [Salix suchowensis]|uniref:RRM domain-containing protein n=1 Tax=Salix suchowensis TaxID=1278906 RepID=A0ABQ8ZVM6_9ROSI|nr:hypothetical protein OIU77_013947 [Salix suchowensis]